ncbi:phosphatidylethanolamine-binding protein [Xylariales sp. PMI_506]|nr:phosphatidylethanolamine-binding protein [Xylariales sp. PMI_506]
MPNNTVVDKTLKALQDGTLPKLDVSFPQHASFETGHYIPRGEARTDPQFAFPGAGAGKTYLIFCLDLDAPFISFNFLSPILHLTQPGLILSSSSPSALEAKEPYIVNWGPPGPPPGAAPHRYVFFLYEQPAAFDTKKYAPAEGKPVGISGRVRYSLDDFAKEAGLGEVLAANYFTSN